MHSISVCRSLGALLALFLSAILLLIWNREPTSLATLTPLAEDVSNVDISPSAIDRHDNLHRHSDLHASHLIQKRIRELNYKDAVCKGKKLYGLIQDAFDGKRAPGRDFGQADVDNGWTRQGTPRQIAKAWDPPLQEIGSTLPNVGNRTPDTSEAILIDMVQDRPFRNSAGSLSPIPKRDGISAHYEVFYIPLWNSILSSDAVSPRYQVEALHDFEIDPSDVPKLIPPLNRQSDVMWTVWKNISRTPNDLRYIFRGGVLNQDSRGIMEDVWDKTPTKQRTPWPGLTFGMDTEEGQALLGCPNGFAVAYLLMDRAKQLGRRNLRVTISASRASPGQDQLGYRMLWDMQPPPAPQLTLSLPGPELDLTFSSKTASATNARTT